MTDRDAAAEWVERYLRAWDSNDPDDLRAAFTEDVEYRFKPFEPPVVGLDALTAKWLEGRDEPGDHAFRWRIAAVDGDVVVIDATTEYTAGPVAGRGYANLWLLRLEPDGRASSFTEWWMESTDSA